MAEARFATGRSGKFSTSFSIKFILKTAVVRKNSHGAAKLLPSFRVLLNCIKPFSAPTNIHGANRPIWDEYARQRPRQDDAKRFLSYGTAPRTADQEYPGQATYAVCRRYSGFPKLSAWPADAPRTWVSTNPSTRGEWCQSPVRKSHSPWDFVVAISAPSRQDDQSIRLDPWQKCCRDHEAGSRGFPRNRLPLATAAASTVVLNNSDGIFPSQIPIKSMSASLRAVIIIATLSDDKSDGSRIVLR